MMDLKFRVWSKDLGGYREFDGNSDDQSLGMGLEAEHGIGSNTISIYHSIGDTIEQFTGLKDKNDKEIYEGDILSWHTNAYRKQDWVGLVVYRGAGFVVQESDHAYSSPEWLACACREDANIIEIIGNVHENPELLED